MNKQKPAVNSVRLRVATAMYQMGIDGLPRNYELVFEAYSGSNPELTKELVALGKIKSQLALDELGKKYLPHHHEETVVAKTNERMLSQMATLVNLLEEEKLSLSDYSKVIDEANQSLNTDGEIDQDTLTRSIQNLNTATKKQESKSDTMLAAAARQAAELEEVRSEISHFERMKFVDALSGLANRRAFNKAIARVYANPDMPMLCGLAFAEIDDFKQFSEKGFGDHFIRHVGGALQSANIPGNFAARLDGNRFVFLINSAEETEIMRLVDILRKASASKPLINPQNGRSIGNATLSFGVAMSTVTNGGSQLVAYAEKAMVASSGNGGDQATLYSNTVPVGSHRSWMIYRP